MAKLWSPSAALRTEWREASLGAGTSEEGPVIPTLGHTTEKTEE